MALAVKFFKYQKRDLEENLTLTLDQKFLGRIYNLCELVLKTSWIQLLPEQLPIMI